MACDPFWNKTVLACHFDGSNGSTTFTDEKGHTLTANGTAQLTTTSPKFGTACATFDGTGDYIVAAASADYVVGSAEFTLEAWVYFSGFATNHAYGTCLFDLRPAGSYASGMALFANSSGVLTAWDSNSTATQSGSGKVTTGQWYHIAICRSGGRMRVFVDGVTAIDYAHTTSYAPTTTTLVIGTAADYQDSSVNFKHNGKIDEVRFTKAARYAASFAPPSSAFADSQCTISGVVRDASNALAARLVRTLRRDSCELLNLSVSDASTGVYSHEVETTAECMVLSNDGTPTDPYAANVKLALKMAGTNGSTTFTDDAGHTTTANGDVKIVSGAFPYGRSAAYFDGTGDYIACTYSTDYEVGSGDFTVEFWFKVPDVSGQKTLFAFQTDFHIGVFLNGARMNCFASSNGSSWDIISGDSGGSYGAGYTDVTANVWHHFAWVRSGTTWTMWLDGAVDRQLTGFSGTVFTRNEAFNIGRWGNAGYFMKGHIKDFRLTNGTARYATAFSPPLPDFLTVSGGTENALIFDRVIPT